MAQLPRTLRFGTHLAQGARRLAVDSALGGRRSFPRTVGDLTAENLSAITGRRITSAALLDEEPGTSTHARLALTGDDVPGSVFVKMSAGSLGIRMLGELAGLGETEALFYRHLAPDLGDRDLPGFALDADRHLAALVRDGQVVRGRQRPSARAWRRGRLGGDASGGVAGDLTGDLIINETE